MKTGFCVFLAAFVALGASWFGFVYGPLRQLGGARQTVILQSTDNWPLQRTCDATLGLQVYRACGCVACHTGQVRQTGVADELTLTSLGGYQAADFKEYVRSQLNVPDLMNASNAIMAGLDKWNGQVPVTLYSGDDSAVVAALGGKLKVGGLKTDASIVATGPDLLTVAGHASGRGWGVRQSVAADYLYDQPVQLGSLRAGPDLTTIGVREPDVNWQLQHLYAPRSVVKNSTMPAFRFLFNVRRIGPHPAPDALVLPGDFAPPAGFEVVPTTRARQLAAYLVSLKASAPLYEAPFTPVTAAK